MKRNRKLLITSVLLTITAIVLSMYIFNKTINIGNRGNSKKPDNTLIGTSPTNDGKNIGFIPEALPGNPIEIQAAEGKDIKVKAIYLTGTSAGNKAYLDKMISIINTTELNAVVIDVKEDGKVNYESNVAQVKETGAYQELYDPDYVIKTLHDNGVYVIGRVVCFRDNYMASKRPDLAIKKADGSLWKENGKIAWTNPYLKEVWNYNIEIGKEAIDKGFDEIQFDYVRFPTASASSVSYGQGVPEKAEAISGFLKAASDEFNKKNVPVSADVFAIICESAGDREGIGQVLEKVGIEVDYISPMIYPSHYANNSKGMMGNGVGQSINNVLFTAPDLKPYDVVYNALLKTKDRISKVGGYKAKVRPYLQYFTATYLPKGYYQNYGPEQIRQQIKAVYDAGYEEWIFWDSGNRYKDSSFQKE
ncbi:putative glycoside hydrolase [Acetivibrio cellulolyticus]|uniref:putative glycoside hydrolase n=1 Tax=Acetivibrio cellulolyticus TaxID=35830 RepID=UPI0001E2D886|nr:putative glycoside hydrolase [Acetivibrio cellulolyticus]